MTSRSLTISDLMAISGYTRDQMRGLLEAIPAYATRDTRVRVAKQYTAHDLLMVRTCSQLESRFRLQRGVVAGFSDLLRSVLSCPRPVSATARLLLTFDPLDVRYVESLQGIQEGLLVPLVPIFQVVDEYLLPSRTQVSWNQRELGFGPLAVNSTTSARQLSAHATAERIRQPRRRL